jgi:diguanylate cyclase
VVVLNSLRLLECWSTYYGGDFMINDLFINTLLLISFTFVGGHVSREIPESLRGTIFSKVILGVAGGILGILTMIYAIQVIGTNTLLDLRSLSILMISSVGGFTSILITGLIIAIYRIGHYGINQSSIFALAHIILYIVLFSIANKKIKNPAKNWFTKLTCVVFILVSTFLYLLRDVENNYLIIFNFSLVVISAGILEYFLFEYAKRSNELYIIYKTDSTKDFLTGLNNTRQFDKLLNMSFERVIGNNEKLSCLMVDIDHFKRVNDTFGHAVGDIVLKELADILEKNCRAFDFVGRVGGEEFCILLLDCPSVRSFEIGTRIRNYVKENKFTIGDNKFINITVSIGAASYPETVSNIEEIVEKADIGLYRAKQTGRDKVCDYEKCIEI